MSLGNRISILRVVAIHSHSLVLVVIHHFDMPVLKFAPGQGRPSHRNWAWLELAGSSSMFKSKFILVCTLMTSSQKSRVLTIADQCTPICTPSSAYLAQSFIPFQSCDSSLCCVLSNDRMKQGVRLFLDSYLPQLPVQYLRLLVLAELTQERRTRL